MSLVDSQPKHKRIKHFFVSPFENSKIVVYGIKDKFIQLSFQENYSFRNLNSHELYRSMTIIYLQRKVIHKLALL